jgi:hypothetical protein
MYSRCGCGILFFVASHTQAMPRSRRGIRRPGAATLFIGDYMDRPVSIFVRNGLYSVCTAVAVIAHNVGREQAILAIGDHVPGATPQEINSWLNNPSDAAEFRATFASSTANTLTYLEEQIAAMPTTPEVEAIAEQVKFATDSLDEMRKEIRRSEIRRYIHDLEAEAESRIQNILKEEDNWPYQRAWEIIWNHVGFGAAIAEWKKFLEELE